MIATEETTQEITQTGRYRRVGESRLGETNSAYEAYDAVLETTVMLREMPIRLNKVTSLGQQDTLRAAFAEDAKVLTTIKNESIQRVVDFFSEVDRHCLVMESVNGSDLADLLEKKKYPFPVNDVVNWADQLLEALQFLHTYMPPIFHRDVRPRNLKLTPGGKIKLMGLVSTKNPVTGYEVATGADLSYLPLELIWSGLDAASQKVITNSYDDRSERLLRQPPDARSDIYSVGATLYHLLTGTLPVDALERSIDTLDGKADPLRSPHDLDKGVPVEISEVLMRAMEIKRENRYDSTVIMRQVLRTALVRVKEREAIEAVEQEEMNAAWETSLAEEKRLEEQRTSEEKARLELEAAEALRQAEEQKRLEAEAEESRRRIEEQKRLEAEAEESRRQLEEQKRLEAEAEESRRQLEEQMRLDHEAAEVQAYEDKRVAELKIDSEREHLELEKQIAEQKKLDHEIEQRRQAELIERQLRDAEADRLLAEQREAEAKKLLLVRELEDIDDSETVLPIDDSPRPVAADTDILEVPATAVTPVFEQDTSADEMFADHQTAGKTWWKIPAAGLALVIVAGAFFAIWSFLSTKTATPDPAASGPVMSVAPETKPEPAVESTTLPAAGQAPENGTENSANAANTAGQTPAKNKQGAQPQPEVKKPAAAPAKTPAAKKPVTVDDLIKDN
jgi:serine/threonine protein kinase